MPQQINDGTNVVNPGTNTSFPTTTTTTTTTSGGGGSWYPTDTAVTQPASSAKHTTLMTKPWEQQQNGKREYVDRTRTLTPADHMRFDATGRPINTKRVLMWNINDDDYPSEEYALANSFQMTSDPFDVALAQGFQIEDVAELTYGDTTVYVVPWKKKAIQSDVPLTAHGVDMLHNPYHPLVDVNTGLEMQSATIEDNPLNVRVNLNNSSGEPGNVRQMTFRGSVTSLLDGAAAAYYQRLVLGQVELENIIVPKDRNYDDSSWKARGGTKFLDGTTNETDPGVVFVEPENEFGSAATYASPKQTLSPLHPFTRVHPEIAHRALLTSYNRTKLPIADIEHRKAFRHIFITRPECYICCAPGSSPSADSLLSEQAMVDEEFYASYQRFPHVSQMLSPVYVCPTPGGDPRANWNYLLTNRVQGLSVAATTLGVRESYTPSGSGIQIATGTTLTSLNGGTLDLQFRDTKYMDVYEMLRMWMWYIHKRCTGEFFPPFSGYQYQNTWAHSANGNGTLNGYTCSHPYDRALEYASSLFDIVVDETGKNIIYWCKYYGIFPISVTNPMLSNDKNAALTAEPLISTSFRYQYKIENTYRTLIEFNYNAGLDISNGLTNTVDEDAAAFMRSSCYFGAGSMFTGTPFIVAQKSMKRNPLDPTTFVKYVPQLAFHLPRGIGSIDYMNEGLVYDREGGPSAKPTSTHQMRYVYGTPPDIIGTLNESGQKSHIDLT